MDMCLSVNNLKIDYPGFALDIPELTIPKGMVVGLVGENGAGKTTLFKALLNLLPEATGQVTLLGQDMKKNDVQVKKELGVILDEMYFNNHFTVRQVGNVLKGVFKQWDDRLFVWRLQAEKIELSKTLGELSTGMKAKLKIIAALSHKPKLLILDEPTSGLDPVSRDDILEMFQNYLEEEGEGILFSSHITTDIEKIADYILFIDEGKISFELSKDELQTHYGLANLTKRQWEELGEFPYLYQRRRPHSYECLINNRQEFQQEYPELVVKPASIEDVLLMIKKGEPK